MKLLEDFAVLLTEKVNLSQAKLDQLDERVDSVTDVLKSASNFQGAVLDTIPQGSWAHRTIIRPPVTLEFDADFLVQIAELPAWNFDPQQYSEAVWAALSSHGTYGPSS